MAKIVLKFMILNENEFVSDRYGYGGNKRGRENTFSGMHKRFDDRKVGYSYSWFDNSLISDYVSYPAMT